MRNLRDDKSPSAFDRGWKAAVEVLAFGARDVEMSRQAVFDHRQRTKKEQASINATKLEL